MRGLLGAIEEAVYGRGGPARLPEEIGELTLETGKIRAGDVELLPLLRPAKLSAVCLPNAIMCRNTALALDIDGSLVGSGPGGSASVVGAVRYHMVFTRAGEASVRRLPAILGAELSSVFTYLRTSQDLHSALRGLLKIASMGFSASVKPYGDSLGELPRDVIPTPVMKYSGAIVGGVYLPGEFDYKGLLKVEVTRESLESANFDVYVDLPGIARRNYLDYVVVGMRVKDAARKVFPPSSVRAFSPGEPYVVAIRGSRVRFNAYNLGDSLQRLAEFLGRLKSAVDEYSGVASGRDEYESA